MMVRRARAARASSTTRAPTARPAIPSSTARVYRLGDWAFVGILLVIALTGFVLEGVRIAMDHPGYAGTQFGGWVAAQIVGGFGHPVLAGLRHGLWWFHGLLAIAFVASIPYTKAAHMLTSFLSLALRDPLAGKRLRSIPPELAAEPAGYGALPTSARCTCSSSTPARSAGAAMRRARRTRPAGRSRRAT